MFLSIVSIAQVFFCCIYQGAAAVENIYEIGRIFKWKITGFSMQFPRLEVRYYHIVVCG
jgi:hypothetical protein